MQQRYALSEGQRLPDDTSVFRHFGAFWPCGSWPPSEHTTLKNTVKKTPFATPWIITEKNSKKQTVCNNFQKRGNHPQFQEKRFRSKKTIPGALGEFRGILGAALGIQKVILGIRKSILGMASHDLSNTKTTIFGATPGAIPGIDGDPHEKKKNLSFAPAFLERFFKNWGGPRTPEILYPKVSVPMPADSHCEERVQIVFELAVQNREKMPAKHF